MSKNKPASTNQVVENHDLAENAVSAPAAGKWFSLRLPFFVLVLLVTVILFGGYVYQRQRVRDELSSRCKELQAKQNWVALRESADELRKLDPSSAEPWVMKAIACEETQDVEGMVSSIDRIPQNHPRFVDFNVRKVIVEFHDLNRPWDGLKTCDRILEVNSLVTGAHSEAIDFCLLTQQRVEMVKRIRRAIYCRRERPEDYVYLVSTSWMIHPSTFAANSHWLKSDENSETFQVARAIPIYYSKAKESGQAEDFANVPPHSELLNRYPQNLELLIYLIHAKIEDGDVQGTQAALERLPKTAEADKDARIWRARGWCEDAKGNLSASAEFLQKAHQCDPYWSQLYYELYDVYRRSGNQKSADHFHKLYVVGRELTGGISIVVDYLNKGLQDQELNLRNSKFLPPIHDLAEMIGDLQTTAAIEVRLNEKRAN